MALSRLTYNSLNVTPTASKGIGFDSGADDLAATFSGGDTTFIKKLTASASGTLDFLNGTSDVVFDDTYKEYLFTFKNIHPSGDGADGIFQFQVDTGTNTSYNIACTSTFFLAYHNEADTATSLAYEGSGDQAQGTAFQYLGSGDTDNDSGIAGYLRIFNPASTTFVKHFMGQTVNNPSAYAQTEFIGGYFNTTTALTRVQFKMASGNIDAGDICLYGIN